MVVAGLRKAWETLRFDHPSIAAVDSNDGNILTYDVHDTYESLKSWTDETFIVERDAQAAEDVMASIGPCRQAQLHVLPLEYSWQIGLHTAHWRSDGRGLPHLLDRLLCNLTHPRSGPLQWGEETSRLTISLKNAGGMAEEVSPADEARVKEMATQLLKGSPALTISCIGDANTVPESPRRSSGHAKPAI